jgi:hypothetical protein
MKENRMNKTKRPLAVTMCDGDLRAWVEQEAIHLKAVDSHGDPLELTANEVRDFAQQLLELAEKIKD